MKPPIVDLALIATTSRRVAGRALTICENRIELLMVEVQEERDRLLHVLLLALGLALSGLLASMAASAAIVIWLWDYSPLCVLLALAVFYTLVGGVLCWFLARHVRNWRSFAASLDQLRKDRACMERFIA